MEKPLLGREGQNVSLYSTHGNIISSGIYGNGTFMYQQVHPLPNFDGNYSVIGSWVIDSQSAGIGVREDKIPIINNSSCFVPHFID